MKAVGAQETQQEMIDHLEEENRQMLDAGLRLQDVNAQLLEALESISANVWGEMPPQAVAHIRDTARAAIKAAKEG